MTTDPAGSAGVPPPRTRHALFSRVRLADLVLWYVSAAVIVFVVPSVVYLGARPWRMPAGDEVQAWYWLVAFLLSAFGLTLVRAGRGSIPLAWFAMLAVGPWVLGYLALMLRSGIGHSRAVALISAIIGSGMLVMPAVISPMVMPLVTRVVAVTTLAAVIVTTGTVRAGASPAPIAARDSIINTALVPLTVTYESGLVSDVAVPGGAIARLGRGLLLVTGAGTWYDVGWDPSGMRLRARRLDIPPPMRRDTLPAGLIRRPFQRITGLALAGTAASVTAYAAHEVWRARERCVFLQVSAMQLNGLTTADTAWRPVFATQPCIQPDSQYSPFETGGRLLLQPDGALLLTVGDFGYSRGANAAFSQRPDIDYGKTLRITPDGRRTIFTTGHRNSGGLTVDSDGNLWATEHGPRGGDELNLLEPGANYGWPVETHGTQYGTYRWRDVPASSSAAFREPSAVLVPSVGISSVIAVRGTLFTPWTGNLLAGSLQSGQLLRFGLTGARVAYTEPITIGRRIRDLAEAEDGRIVLWTDEGDLVWLAPATDVMRGAFAYESCYQCHGLADGTGTRVAPVLSGILGRRIASSQHFVYSEALRKMRGVWTAERLNAFLQSPATFAPGNTMQFAGIADSAERRLLVEFLAETRPPASRDPH